MELDRKNLQPEVKVVCEYVDAWNTHDSKAVSSMFTSDATYSESYAKGYR